MAPIEVFKGGQAPSAPPPLPQPMPLTVMVELECCHELLRCECLLVNYFVRMFVC